MIKCEACRAFYYFSQPVDKFNNTGARMLDFIYHMTLKLIKKRIFWRGNVKILPSFTQRYNGRHNVSRKSVNHYWDQTCFFYALTSAGPRGWC